MENRPPEVGLGSVLWRQGPWLAEKGKTIIEGLTGWVLSALNNVLYYVLGESQEELL